MRDEEYVQWAHIHENCIMKPIILYNQDSLMKRPNKEFSVTFSLIR